MASTVLTKASTLGGGDRGMGVVLQVSIELAFIAPSQNDGVTDAYQEAVHAADPSADDVALRCRSGDSG